MPLQRFVDEERGAAIVEFALVLPILLLVLWGIVDIGRAFYTLNTLASAVREGARAGAVMAVRPDNSANTATIRTTVGNAFAPIGPPLDPAKVGVAVNDITRQVTVTATYDFAPLVLVGWTFPITRAATFRWEQAP